MKNALLILLILLLPVWCFSQEITHVVQKGETLYSISRKYNLQINTIIEYNKISDPSKIAVGTIIKIPFLYRVEKGDTLYSIARRFGTSLDALLKLNNMQKDRVLKVGDLLVLPVNSEAAIAAARENPVISTATTAQESPKTAGPVNISAQVSWPHQGSREPLTGKLEGIAILGNPGDSVISVTAGEVVLVQPFRGYGKLICIQSHGNYIYAYAGNEITLVKVGDKVAPGMEIGRLGINPHAKEAKLFFTVSKDGKIIDPEKAPRG